MPKLRRILVALAATALVFTSGCTAQGQDTKPSEQVAPVSGKLPKATADAIGEALDNALAATRATGGVVGVWAPWAGSLELAAGSTSLNSKTPMTTDMTYRIGAQTRQWTCTVMLRLVDEGVVSLDEKLGKLLAYVEGVEDITLQQLCQSTSGLGDFSSALKSVFMANPTRPWSRMELLASGLGMKRTTQPGERFINSDTGYLLVGLALERATGLTWDELYKKYVFDPAGMKHSSLPADDVYALPSPHPDGYGYELDAVGKPICEAQTDLSRASSALGWTATGAISNMHDMRIFANLNARGALVSDKSAAALWDGVPLNPRDENPWQFYAPGGYQLGQLFGQSGMAPGFISAAFSDPSSGFTVVVALNNSGAGAIAARALAQQLASIVWQLPSTTGEAAPAEELPWSEQAASDLLQRSAICQPEPEPEEKPAQ